MIEATFLWPSKPSEESWKSDTPNEGLLFDEDGIASMHADYHGHLIVSNGALAFVPLELPPTTDKQYLAAYTVLLEEFAPSWDPEREYFSWASIINRIIGRLRDELRWVKVIADPAETNGHFWEVVPWQ